LVQNCVDSSSSRKLVTKKRGGRGTLHRRTNYGRNELETQLSPLVRFIISTAGGWRVADVVSSIPFAFRAIECEDTCSTTRSHRLRSSTHVARTRVAVAKAGRRCLLSSASVQFSRLYFSQKDRSQSWSVLIPLSIDTRTSFASSAQSVQVQGIHRRRKCSKFGKKAV